MTVKRVEFYYFPDCPSYEKGYERLTKVMSGLGLQTEIEVQVVETEELAKKLGFIGSPSILVNGADIDPEGLKGQAAALTCRTYMHEDGRFSPLPSEEQIRNALLSAASGQ